MEKLGRFTNMTNSDYHLSPGISSTGIIKYVDKSPRHYKSYIEREHEQTPAMALGSAIHCSVLEPGAFSDRYVQRPEGISFATKEGKAWREANNSKEILTFEDYEMCRSIYKQVHTDEVTKILFTNGYAENSIFWKDKETDVLCKCRPDWLIEKPSSDQLDVLKGVLPEQMVELVHENTSIIIDVKSTEDASPKGFINSMNRYNFGIPSTFYTAGVCEYLKKDDVIFLFLMIEKNPPFTPVIYLAGKETTVRSASQIATALAGIKYCEENNYWPGYTHGKILEANYFDMI